jgi:hypothetical protein
MNINMADLVTPSELVHVLVEDFNQKLQEEEKSLNDTINASNLKTKQDREQLDYFCKSSTSRI